MEGCVVGQQRGGGVTSFPSWSPSSCWILPPLSCGLAPPNAPRELGRSPKPHQQTCEALLGKSLFWHRWQQVLLVSLWACLPALLGARVGESASGVSLGPTHCETLRNGWMVGEAVSLEVGLLESAQWCRNGEYGRMWKKLDLRVGLWNPFPNTLQKESKNQSLRDRFQAKTKSSRCITCIIKNSYIYIYIYIYISLH